MSLADKLTDKVYESGGKRSAASVFAKNIARSGVARTPEFIRIEKLPRRDWATAIDLEQLTIDTCAALKTPGGTMALRQVQVAALRDLWEWKGLVAACAVGAGKALISLLAPVVLDAKRPVLIVPASLRPKTTRKLIPSMRAHWKLHRNLMVLGYEELGLAKNADLLETLQPDLIICDEVHKLRNLSCGRGRRMNRYMKTHPETMFVGLSGTITKKSIKDYAHICRWALKEDMSPLPNRFQEMQDWADAIDAGSQREADTEAAEAAPKRIVQPGALKLLCGKIVDETTNVERDETIREGYMRRLVQTPGIIATGASELATSLQILKRDVTCPEHMRHLLQNMRDTWETPNGDEIVDSITLWKHARELCCGFFYKWDPAPPPEWLGRRKRWFRYIRETLSTNRRNLDTPLQVINEVVKKLKDPKLQRTGDAEILKLYTDWREIEPSFKPNTVAVWEDDFLVNDASAWLAEKENAAHGIVWVEHDAFAKALAKKSGRPYLGGGEKANNAILDVTGGVILSIEAHHMGKDLQDRYHKNLIVSPPPNGERFEQLLGRTHREGQPEDTVVVELYLFAEEQQASFERARALAEYTQVSTGMKQKLCYADIAVD